MEPIGTFPMAKCSKRRFRLSVHHPSSSLNGSFFLLATFKIFCEFGSSILTWWFCGCCHVKFLGDRHLRFCVASKAVGVPLVLLLMSIFISGNDGVAHWEWDKRTWEEEQAKEWTLVTYKKRTSRPNAKRVNFATRLVQASPPVKQKPALKIGSFFFSTQEATVRPRKLVFGTNKSSLDLNTVGMDQSLLTSDPEKNVLCSSLDNPGSKRVHEDPKSMPDFMQETEAQRLFHLPLSVQAYTQMQHLLALLKKCRPH
ncbi:hypothetical protein EJB05_02782, partial [Eragrostis curvula]